MPEHSLITCDKSASAAHPPCITVFQNIIIHFCMLNFMIVCLCKYNESVLTNKYTQNCSVVVDWADTLKLTFDCLKAFNLSTIQLQ